MSLFSSPTSSTPSPAPKTPPASPASEETPTPSFAQSIFTFIREEFTGWKRWEVLWFSVSCAVVCGLSLYWGDTLMGIISATTGIAYTLCNGKGKRIAYIFGMINSLLYAIISFNTGYYGEVMLNGLYYFPMMFVGLIAWNRHMDTSTHEVSKRKMNAKQRLLLTAIIAAGTATYGCVLFALGDALPFVDAFTTFASVVAMVVAIKRYMEQWFLWTAVNAVTVIMWGIAFAQGAETIATLVMWCVYLATGIIMYFKWRREIIAEDPTVPALHIKRA